MRSSIVNALVVAALATVAPATARAQARTTAPAAVVSAPVSDIRYDVAFDNSTAPARTLKVTMTFATSGAAPVISRSPSPSKVAPSSAAMSFTSTLV